MEPAAGTSNRDAAAASVRRKQVTDAVQTWSGQLIDFGGRNQLLYYRDLKVGTLDLADADPNAVGSLMDGRTVPMSRLFGPELLPDRLKRARAIRNKAREGLEERGIATCFVAIGMATWTNTRGTSTPAAPILLREASIVATGAAETEFEIALTGETEVNPTLLHLLDDQFAVTLDDDELLDLIGPGRFDPQALFDQLAKASTSVAGFAIAARKVLGTFSYAKLPMVTDLNANLDAIVAHDVISAIAGDRGTQLALVASGSRVDITDPDRMSPDDEFLVLDADSSQSYAINAAVAGQSLVLSGPPGTGKSQTIANLIATFVARGQSVLFVAEKRAAISAVLNRLTGVGLGGLVLDLHGGVGSRSALARQLAAGLHASSEVPRPDQVELHQLLVSRRARLNDHEQAVHRSRTPWDVSAFDAQCALLGLTQQYGGAARCGVQLRGEVLARLDATTKRHLDDHLYEYAGLGGLTLTQSESLWADSTILSQDQAQAALEGAIRASRTTVPTIERALAELVRRTGLRRPTMLSQWRGLLGLLNAVAVLGNILTPDIFAAAIPEMVAATASRTWRKQHTGWPGAAANWSSRRRCRKAAAAFVVGPQKLSRSELHAALLRSGQILQDWRLQCTDNGFPRIPVDLVSLQGSFDQLILELAGLGGYLTGVDFAGLPADQLAAALGNLAADERTLRKMPRLNQLKAGFLRLGLADLLSELKNRRLGPAMAVAVFNTCWYQSILDRAAVDDPILANFNAGLLDNSSTVFRDADNHHIEQAAQRVRRAAAERLVQARDQFPDQSLLVQSQADRKRGHLPLRQLFSAAPDVMIALKPCWAMSPLVVSQLLPGDQPYFDVVVFDEASQIVPADAIPSILRAHRVIVTGDKHQLPPTSFFAAASDGDDDIAQAVNADGSINLAFTTGFESILDSLNTVLGEARTRSLTWHYRSADERLIAFSNAWIYDNSLTTFPGISGQNCLSHVFVDGRANAPGQEDSVTAEVERVVTLMLDHAAARPLESLGVITMGVKHRDRIDGAFRQRLRSNPQLFSFFDESQKEKYFVKNLETVQGDERDAIILSIGYGKTPDGRLPYRFGPLLQDGGERRLNVAITRARRRMTLVSSFSAHDMDPTRSTAAGVAMLRAYLQYAESGGARLGDIVLDKPALNPFEISVRDQLQAAGIPVIPQYGVAGFWIDFAAPHPTKPGQMVLAIEADGASYHSSSTARDRDRLRQEQLERLGWTFHRIWSTEWFNDTATCVAEAVTAYRRAVAAADGRAASARTELPAAVPAQPTDPPPVRLVSPPSDRRPGRPMIYPGTPITEYSDAELVLLIRWIESDTLLRTAAQLYEAFVEELGYKRRGSRIRAAFDRVLPTARKPR